jgi:hypothetical protein
MVMGVSRGSAVSKDPVKGLKYTSQCQSVNIFKLFTFNGNIFTFKILKVIIKGHVVKNLRIAILPSSLLGTTNVTCFLYPLLKILYA